MKMIDRSSDVPLYLQLKQILQVEIEPLEPDTRLPTDRELASTYNLALATVQRVMRDLAREGYIHREVGRGSFVACRDQIIEDADMLTDPKFNVALVYPNVISSIIMEQINELEKIAVPARVSFIHFKLHSGRWLTRLEQFIQKKHSDLDGVILIPPSDLSSPDQLAVLDKTGLKTILVSACDDDCIYNFKNLFFTGMDRYAAGQLVIEKLRAPGHRNIFHVTNEPFCYDMQLYSDGMRKAMLNGGLIYRSSEERPENWMDSADFAYEYLSSHGKEIVETCTAIVFDSAVGATAGIHYLWQNGIKVPEKISILAGDYDSRYRYYIPPISGIVQDNRLIARTAVDILTGERTDKKILLPALWIEGAGIA